MSLAERFKADEAAFESGTSGNPVPIIAWVESLRGKEAGCLKLVGCILQSLQIAFPAGIVRHGGFVYRALSVQ